MAAMQAALCIMQRASSSCGLANAVGRYLKTNRIACIALASV